jgi:hypothetical protein
MTSKLYRGIESSIQPNRSNLTWNMRRNYRREERRKKEQNDKMEGEEEGIRRCRR